MVKPIKYALLKYVYTNNIGDEIQSIAAKRFLPSLDYYIDRDNINEFNEKENVKVIINGWFTHNPENWPPQKSNIHPLLISFHITKLYHETLTRPESIRYFKKHEPVGCRDYHTVKLLRDKGVNAYFSGCLTLTLENKFKKRKELIYFVDVADEATKLIPEHVKDKITFLSHSYNPFTMRLKWKFPSVFWIGTRCFKNRFKRAQKHLDMYAQAKLVVTSRLHCALPCLAFGTPVIFITNNLEDWRFPGLIELLKHYSYDDVKKGKAHIDWDNPSSNPVSITPIRNKLIKTCEDFIKKQ